MSNISLIKASAGSGKTYHLMELLSKKITDGVTPERLLATTFTVKAANELKSRIRQEILKGDHPELASGVFDGLIGTVNGVCGELLKEYAVDAGLSPALDVLPEENADAIFNAAVTKSMDRYAAELEDVAARLNMSPIRKQENKKDRDWKKDVRYIVNLARSNALTPSDLQKCAERSIAELKEIFTAGYDLSLDDIAKSVKPFKDYPAVGGDTQKTVQAVRDFLRFPTWAGAAKLGEAKYTKTKDKDFDIEVFRLIGENLLQSKELYQDLHNMIRSVFACAGDAMTDYEHYKKDLGLIDFVDQEAGVLELLKTKEGFRTQLQERLAQIMVDEFQDTSPIQLALFLKMNECCPRGSVWVGDPKQAIYGFRGTDPELMEAVANTVTPEKTLEFSWRSREKLVELSNAIFTRAFADMKPEDVRLGIPAERRESALGGTIDTWLLDGSNAKKRMKALAHGIADLIRTGTEPRDICVLFRSNSECADLAEALAACNISASAPSGELMDTQEAQLVMAAFRYCIYPKDTVALATLLALYGDTPSYLNQLHKAKQAFLALPDKERKGKDFLSEIRNQPIFLKLGSLHDATPMEVLEHVISVLNLDRKAAAMSSPDRRMSNLDELRKLCTNYMNQALLSRSAATPAGFVAYLAESGAEQAPGFGRNTVNVMTYHKSKGLEFPVVILGSLDSEGKNGAFGTYVNQAPEFDVRDPLKDRSIHYWPYPFGQMGYPETLKECLKDNPIELRIKKRDAAEEKRLFYVGLTRAKDRLIFAMQRNATSDAERKENPDVLWKLKHSWIDSLTGNPVIDFPVEEGFGDLIVGDKTFPIHTSVWSGELDPVPLPSPKVFADKEEDLSGLPHYPAKASPSLMEKESGTATLVGEWQVTGTLEVKDNPDRIGNAFHNYIAMNPQTNQKAIAERLIRNWEIEASVSPETMIECSEALYRWLAATYPNAGIACEVPMTVHDKNGTLYQGFIDMLLECPDGYVIVDHKTGLTSDPAGYAATHKVQLGLYRQAVETATGKKVKQTLIHLPNLGKCYEVK